MNIDFEQPDKLWVIKHAGTDKVIAIANFADVDLIFLQHYKQIGYVVPFETNPKREQLKAELGDAI